MCVLHQKKDTKVRDVSSRSYYSGPTDYIVNSKIDSCCNEKTAMSRQEWPPKSCRLAHSRALGEIYNFSTIEHTFIYCLPTQNTLIF